MSGPGDEQAPGADAPTSDTRAGTTSADGGLGVWIKAGAMILSVVLVIGLVKTFTSPRPANLRRDLAREVNAQFGLQLTDADAQCMVGAGYGNYIDLAALACLQGESRRYFADVLFRSVGPTPASPAQVECFTNWAMRDTFAEQLMTIGRSSKSTTQAVGLATDLIERNGLRPCVSAA